MSCQPNTQGNWLHIQYQSKLQAQKALSKNGKVLANSLMVGVMPCIDKVNIFWRLLFIANI